jgi:hypothetical protein
MNINSDFSDLLCAFSDADVRYLIVGGYAFSYYAEPRFTKDFDLWIEASPDNAARVLSALAAFGAPMSMFSVDELAAPGMVFQLGVAPNRIDLLTAIDGIDFAAAWPNRVAAAVAGRTVWIIGAADLATNKRAAGRAQDLSDVAELERVIRGRQ